MPLKIYEYKNCSTCVKALKFLDKNKVAYEDFPSVDQPPAVGELKRMLGFLKKDGKDFKNLFNTSGVQYRELKIADQLKAGMTETEAFTLLSKNGKLIKRPFALDRDAGTVGFNEESFERFL
jgi:arsenate reductase